MSQTNETRHAKWHETCKRKCRLDASVCNVGMMINAGVNVNNSLTKVYAMRDLFGFLVIVNVNAINHVMLENIKIIKIVSVGKN